MKKLGITILFILINTVISKAQIVSWEMLPRDYSKVTCINHNLFKVEQDGRIGLIKSDGEIVAEVNNDSISGYYNGRAVLVRNEGDRMLISGCLTEKGEYYRFATKYYKPKRKNGFPFFSENVMVVCNEQGQEGYINEKGEPVVGFKSGLTHLQPFSEGYAVVKIKGRAALINKEGIPVKLQLPSVGEITNIFNAYNGTVYLTDENAKFYTYSIRSKGTCAKAKSPGDKIRVDYLYRIRSITGKTLRVDFKEIRYNANATLHPVMENGLYGFSYEGQMVVPAQFSEATPFVDNYSVVRLNEKVGILNYIPGEKFMLTTPESSYDFYKNDSVNCVFHLTVPNTWMDESLSIRVRMPDGSEKAVSQTTEGYIFTFKPLDTTTTEFSVTVSATELTLFTGKFSAGFIKRERCLSCGKDKRHCPYHGAHPEEEEDGTEGEDYDNNREKVKQGKDNIFSKRIIKVDRCETCGKDKRFCEYHGKHPDSRQRKK